MTSSNKGSHPRSGARRKLAALVALALPTPVLAQTYSYAYTLVKTFGGAPAADLRDVSVYARHDSPSSGRIFAVGTTTTGSEALFRYTGDGVIVSSAAVQPNYYSTPISTWGTVASVAVNDLPGHCNDGAVYVAVQAMIMVFDTDLNWIGDISWNLGGSNGFIDITGIAVDSEGDLWVADNGRDRFVEFDASDVGMVAVSAFRTAKTVFDPTWFAALDVSVDAGGRIHALHDCGCYPILDPDGSIWSHNGTAGAFLPGAQAVCALDPRPTSWLSKASSSEVSYYEWIPADGTNHGLSTIGSGLSDGRGVDYQKFSYFSLPLFSKTLRHHVAERLFVANGTAGNIKVYEQWRHSSLHYGPSAWYRFEESFEACIPVNLIVRDALGKSHGGTTSMTPPRSVESMVRSGVAFDTGTDNVITIGSTSHITFDTADFTIEGWLLAAPHGSVKTILDKRDGTGKGYTVFLYNDDLGIQLAAGGTNYDNIVSTAEPFADRTWHHFAMVVRRALAQVEFYRDGQWISSEPIDAPGVGVSIASAAPLLIGNHAFNPTTGFEGDLDELTFFRRALSPGEVYAIFTAETAGKRVPKKAILFQ